MFLSLPQELIYPFLTSLTLAIIFTPITIKLARYFNLLDNPKIRPHPAHIQKRTVPRAGGLPVFLSIVLAILFFLPFDKHIIGIILSILVLLITGIYDDFSPGFSPVKRLLLQILSAAIVVASGIGITFIGNPLGGILRLDTVSIGINFLGQHNILLFADLFALVWIVWMMNIINWSKGVDGQMPGIIAVSSATIGYLSYKLFLNGDPNQLPIAVLSFIVAGSSMGFLFFNWYPSKIFPGFSGSTILGFMVATLSILSGAKLATAVLVLLIPTVDFIYTFFRRILSGTSPFLGDQKHLHHLLLKYGFSHKQISLFYIISCAILGLLSTFLSPEGKLFAVVGVGVIALGIILWLQLLYQSKNQKR